MVAVYHDRKKKNSLQNSTNYKCEHCERTFSNEKILASHLCANKLRYLDKNEKNVKLGFWAYQKFNRFCYPSTKEKTLDQFINSKLYADFIRFGTYLKNNPPIYPEQYIEFLLIGQVDITKWALPYIYDAYLRELNKKETPMAAMERTVVLMSEWGDDNNCDWVDFFKEVSTNQATLWLQTGKISPWVFYLTDTSKYLLERMNEEQLNIVQKAIDADFWEDKFERNAADVDAIKAILAEIGI